MKNLLYPGVVCTFILSLAFFSSCKDDDVTSDGSDTTSTYKSINKWIYANMEYWYYWTDELPDMPSTSQNPEDFFDALLSSSDRFSFIYENYTELINLLNGVTLESGFEYKLYRMSASSDSVIMQLMYIKPNSPASELGLKRGDIIYTINGTRFTLDNYSSLISDDMNTTYTATYSRYDFDTEVFEDLGEFSLTPVSYAENPILLDTVYEIEGKKIGYLVYNFFSPGSTNSSSTYDEQLEATFGEFKSAGIQDMIVDLRFNSGGSETSVKTLTSLLVQNASSSDLIFTKTYNSTVQQAILNDDDYGQDYLDVNFLDESNNIGSLLSSGTVHFITSSRTASASEVTMNSLKPYMDIYLVGDTTVGKDVGSITIYDDDDNDNDWAIQPIVVKLVNADDEDYPDGFYPDVPMNDNRLIIYPLGDTEEPLLAASLADIGVETSRLSANMKVGSGKKVLLNSLDKKIRSGKLIMEK